MQQLEDAVYRLVLDFTKKLVEKFDGLIRVTAVFGSRVKGKSTESSDIDVLVVVDDLYNKWDDLVKTYYYKTLNEILSDPKFEKLHVTTITLSILWRMAKAGDPLLISILRVGQPILDSFGLFAALKRMLATGDIKPSKEAILAIKARIPFHINNYNYHIVKALESAYWIFVESFQYLLMELGQYPVSPDEIPSAYKKLQQKYGKKLFKDYYLKWYKGIYELVHGLAHRKIMYVSGDTVEEWYQRALDFKDFINNVVRKLKNK